MANRMLYFPHLTRRTAYSTYTEYRRYRQEIREDCQGRCVYCDIHENEVGGAEYMTLDHFRPKDKFQQLMHDPTNLVWCCQLCNRHKGNVWPAYGTNRAIAKRGGFLDPFTDDPHQYFDVNLSGELLPLKHPAHFLIRILKLNRQGIKTVRKQRRVEAESRAERLRNLTRSIHEINGALNHPELPGDLRSKLSAHKDALAAEYDAVLAERKPDFSLR